MLGLYSLVDVPNEPAIYALYGGQSRNLHVAYVGASEHLRNRLEQHLIRRDSSVAVGTSAACLNPTYVSRVAWWLDEGLCDRAHLEAAELIAFDVLDPALRSRGAIRHDARQLYEDAEFRTRVTSLLQGSPAGTMDLPTGQELWQRLDDLERRVRTVEERLAKSEE